MRHVLGILVVSLMACGTESQTPLVGVDGSVADQHTLKGDVLPLGDSSGYADVLPPPDQRMRDSRPPVPDVQAPDLRPPDQAPVADTAPAPDTLKPDSSMPPDLGGSPDQYVPDQGGSADLGIVKPPDQGTSWPCAPGCQIAGKCVALGVNPANACQTCNPLVNWAAWSNNPGSCNDGKSCTKNDQCVAGTCQGTLYSCNDGMNCTSDWCNGDGTCGHSTVWGCSIDGACYSNGAKHPGSDCYECDTSKSTTAWTSTSYTAGMACMSSATCKGLLCIGATSTTPGVCSCKCKLGYPTACPSPTVCKVTSLSSGQFYCQ